MYIYSHTQPYTAIQLYSANFSRRADLAIIIYLKKKPPLLKKRWNNRNNSGIISGIISESDSSIIPIPSGLWRLPQAFWLHQRHRPSAQH